MLNNEDIEYIINDITGTIILIVEDEEPISNLIKINLVSEGYMCKCAFNGIDAANIIEDEKFDLILLDIMLPGIDGYELLEYIKPFKTPVIFITAKGTVENRIKGLKLGADDYIVKPFQIGELLARIEAVLRRVNGPDKIYEVLGVKINPSSRSVIKDGNHIELTVKEFDLLVELIRNKNIALYRNQLYERVWQEEFMGDTRTIDLHIQRLRKKLGWENHIKTIFRIGYRLEV